jgi:hypothetical protein
MVTSPAGTGKARRRLVGRRPREDDRIVVRVLAVSDEVDPLLRSDARTVGAVQLVLACGDLPFDYLRHLAGSLDVPLVFVPGSHDPDLIGYRGGAFPTVVRFDEPPWPDVEVNADGRVVDVAGLRLAGLGGCRRYAPGPNQYSDHEQARRAHRLVATARLRSWHDGRGVDVLLTHAPPLGVGDAADVAHRGFPALHGVVGRLHPLLLLHGHVHPSGDAPHDRWLGETAVCNVVASRVFDIDPGASSQAGYDGRRAH